MTKKHLINILTLVHKFVFTISPNCTSFNIWKDSVNSQKYCHKCKEDSASEQFSKVYTIKSLVMMETTIYNYHTSFFIPSIQKLAFHIPHVQIMVTYHCGDSRWNSFKRRESFQDAICHREYAEQVVATFAHQIQS